MVRRPLLIGIGGACASAALVFAAAASPATRTASAKEPVLSCSNPIQLGMMGPFTGPVASIGDDQLHWAQFFANNWNLTHKMKLTIVQGDTQLDPAKASVVAQSMASNSSILGVIGPAGSQEVTASAPILKKAGLAFMSGSATNVTLTDGKLKGYFFRVVPNDSVQAPTAADYMMKKLGAKKGKTVMIVDDQESYSTGLADIGRERAQEGRRDGRPRVDQPEGDRLLVARREGVELDEGRLHCPSSSRRRRSSSPSS